MRSIRRPLPLRSTSGVALVRGIPRGIGVANRREDRTCTPSSARGGDASSGVAGVFFLSACRCSPSYPEAAWQGRLQRLPVSSLIQWPAIEQRRPLRGDVLFAFGSDGNSCASLGKVDGRAKSDMWDIVEASPCAECQSGWLMRPEAAVVSYVLCAPRRDGRGAACLVDTGYAPLRN